MIAGPTSQVSHHPLSLFHPIPEQVSCQGRDTDPPYTATFHNILILSRLRRQQCNQGCGLVPDLTGSQAHNHPGWATVPNAQSQVPNVLAAVSAEHGSLLPDLKRGFFRCRRQAWGGPAVVSAGCVFASLRHVGAERQATACSASALRADVMPPPPTRRSVEQSPFYWLIGSGILRRLLGARLGW